MLIANRRIDRHGFGRTLRRIEVYDKLIVNSRWDAVLSSRGICDLYLARYRKAECSVVICSMMHGRSMATGPQDMDGRRYIPLSKASSGLRAGKGDQFASPNPLIRYWTQKQQYSRACCQMAEVSSFGTNRGCDERSFSNISRAMMIPISLFLTTYVRKPVVS
jgi:hypothetical protein